MVQYLNLQHRISKMYYGAKARIIDEIRHDIIMAGIKEHRHLVAEGYPPMCMRDISHDLMAEGYDVVFTCPNTTSLQMHITWGNGQKIMEPSNICMMSEIDVTGCS